MSLPADAEVDTDDVPIRLDEVRRQLADARLREGRYRAIVEAAPDAILLADPGGRILLANTQAEAMLGYRRDELVGQPVELLVPQRARHRHLAAREGYAHDPRTRPMGMGLDLHARRKDGSEFPVEISLSPLASDEGHLTIAVLRDITERRATEERLRNEEARRRTEERFRLLLENVIDVVVVLGPDRRATYASPALLTVLGYEPAALVGGRLREYAHPEDVERVTTFLQDRLAQPGVTPPLEFRFRHRDGSWRTLEAVGNNLLDHPGVAGLVLTLRDVSERRRLQAQFLQTQKMESVGRLAGGVAHDFNNLLTGILSYAELGQEALPDGDPVREHLRIIARAGEQAAALTRQLLLFSRRQVSEARPVDVKGLLDNAVRMLRRLVPESIDLRVVTNDDIGQICVDAGQLEQVLLNLAVNARDAMPDGGRLVIETSVAQLDDSVLRRASGLTAGEFVILSVTDTGTGMTAEVKEHLFEPFFTTKEQGKGTGLGLATCYAIVRQSGGHISVYSEPGQGTTVRIFLPRVHADGVAVQTPETLARMVGGTESILVVEDDPTLRNLVVHVLRDLGYAVMEAASGIEALDLARVRPGAIDLVLTDVVMPGMGGPLLADRLRDVRQGTRVLFMSGYAANATVFQDRTEGDLLLLNKPFTPRLLARKVREVLDRYRSVADHDVRLGSPPTDD